MELGEGIRKIGFRRWHERYLLEGHLYLATSLLCIVVVLAALEGYSSRDISLEFFAGLLLMIAGGAAGVWAFLRYLRMLLVAQRAADRSVCARCKTYGLLEAMGSSARSGPHGAGALIAPTPVRCRKCGNEWTIE